MAQGKRVREVRKTLNLTLEKFGEKVGVTKQTVSRIENGVNNLTDQMAKAICREFNVNESWLRTGEGEMFLNSDNDFIEKIDRIMAGEDDARKDLFKALLDASDADIIAIRNFIATMANLLKDKDEESLVEIPTLSLNMTVAEAEAEYIKSRSAFVKKKASSALNTTKDADEPTNKT